MPAHLSVQCFYWLSQYLDTCVQITYNTTVFLQLHLVHLTVFVFRNIQDTLLFLYSDIFRLRNIDCVRKVRSGEQFGPSGSNKRMENNA